MKLKVSFKYDCEITLKDDEVINIKKRLDENYADELTRGINEMLLAGDGRTEIGCISDFKYKVEE